jgi:uncharacterized membrane protein
LIEPKVQNIINPKGKIMTTTNQQSQSAADLATEAAVKAIVPQQAEQPCATEDKACMKRWLETGDCA